MTRKEHAIYVLNQWLDKFSKSVVSYRLTKKDTELKKLFSKLTASDIEALNTLLSVAYSNGSNETREHMAKLRSDRLKWENEESNKQKGDN